MEVVKLRQSPIVTGVPQNAQALNWGIATLAFLLSLLQTIIRDTLYHKILTSYILIN
jgi:hypothetical protein